MISKRAAVQAIPIADNGLIPNNPRPLLIYKAVMEIASGGAAAVEALFRANGWDGCWRNGVYPFHHYHSSSHEVLGCYSGSAQVQFGGEGGVVVDLASGDAVLIPAGVGHKNLGDRDGFGVVGAYPGGRDYDMCYGRPGERPGADENIGNVPMPERDPVFGEQMSELWPDVD